MRVCRTGGGGSCLKAGARLSLFVQCMYVCMCGQHFQQSTDQPGKVANPARGQLNRENEYFPVLVRA